MYISPCTWWNGLVPDTLNCSPEAYRKRRVGTDTSISSLNLCHSQTSVPCICSSSASREPIEPMKVSACNRTEARSEVHGEKKQLLSNSKSNPSSPERTVTRPGVHWLGGLILCHAGSGVIYRLTTSAFRCAYGRCLRRQNEASAPKRYVGRRQMRYCGYIDRIVRRVELVPNAYGARTRPQLTSPWREAIKSSETERKRRLTRTSSLMNFQGRGK
ncbi:uncharacterized protein EI97DRAFT_191355 [Westerdykella ornata]|uniref:Uncharacterized protein n=1 Tax=Westerdykella ornata TaxID=318751 RepID=A0A6A6J9U7_WESOR|nr:uncharacterized protein EI97DRAFT_191355 [Westerdykella ornata]KAF2273162.1 hypothetical protein EI97DRAFT_191355 [Westerdykella ornata]